MIIPNCLRWQTNHKRKFVRIVFLYVVFCKMLNNGREINNNHNPRKAQYHRAAQYCTGDCTRKNQNNANNGIRSNVIFESTHKNNLWKNVFFHKVWLMIYVNINVIVRINKKIIIGFVSSWSIACSLLSVCSLILFLSIFHWFSIVVCPKSQNQFWSWSVYLPHCHG